MAAIRVDGANLKQIRARMGLTQDQVADRADVAKRTLVNAEQGKPINLETAHRIANALGVGLAELLGREVPGSARVGLGPGGGSSYAYHTAGTAAEVEPRVQWQHDDRLLRLAEGAPRCSRLLAEARDLAESLYSGLKFYRYRVISSLEDHNPGHLQRVERNLAEILFGLGPHNERFFTPSPFEATLLLSAIWLHDIGMLHGIFYRREEDDASPDDRSIEEIDWERYEARTTKYLRQYWVDWCGWSDFEKSLLCALCQFHRPCFDLQMLEDDIGGVVRLRTLAALLRLADTCDIGQDHVSLDLRRTAYPSYSLREGPRHLGITRLIGGVHFDHPSGEVRPFCTIPDEKSFGPVVVDFEPAIRCFSGALGRILSSIEPHLSSYLNTHFHSIEPVIQRMPGEISPPDEHLLDTWPDLISAATSASELASMTALVLRTIVEKSGTLPAYELIRILRQALELNPFNFLVYGLQKRFETLLEIARQEPDERRRRELIADDFAEYLDLRKDACALTARRAADIVDPQGTVVIYEYSQALTEFLSNHSDAEQRIVIAVPCDRKDPCVFAEHENFRVRQLLQEAGLSVQERTVLELPGLIEASRRPVAALLGTRGVFADGTVLSTSGNAAVAAVARSKGAKVIVLAEPDKYRVGAEIEGAVREKLSEQSRRLAPESPDPGGVVVDLLTPDMYDWIVGPEEKPIPGTGKEETD